MNEGVFFYHCHSKLSTIATDNTVSIFGIAKLHCVLQLQLGESYPSVLLMFMARIVYIAYYLVQH